MLLSNEYIYDLLNGQLTRFWTTNVSKCIYVTDNYDPPKSFQPSQWWTRIQKHSHIMRKPLPLYSGFIQDQVCCVYEVWMGAGCQI